MLPLGIMGQLTFPQMSRLRSPCTCLYLEVYVLLGTDGKPRRDAKPLFVSPWGTYSQA